MKDSRSEEAVSAVISIVLIIAVVVILGAVVGTVALGTIGGTQGNAKSVLVTANQGSSGIVFTVQGGMDLRSVTSLDLISGSTITNCTGSAPKVGQGCTVGTDSKGRTVMVAAFTDGSKQVVFDKNWGSVVGSSGVDYATGSITYVSGTTYHLTMIPGPNSGQINTWEAQLKFVGGSSATDSGDSSNLAYDSDISFPSQLTRFTVVLYINDGSTVTLIDQTFT
ncbi:type IV pilin [uncultured Methanoregula sp.]|uniref:type IV pilin n=1 Tax=uncultured Methanoregula sp. TaxID=1005933 RepID=UPI002AAC40DD|nr:type IV pilin [uncultured Methanoregula sp.]